jgi:hypothetical protein
MSANASSRTTAPAPLRTERFWNWKLIGVEIIVTALAALVFLAWEPGPDRVGHQRGISRTHDQ